MKPCSRRAPQPPIAASRPIPIFRLVYDMFAHPGTFSATAERFGEAVFENPLASAGTIPSIFRLAGLRARSGVRATVSRLICGAAFRRALVRTVDHEGHIALPEIGPMLVNGQTLGDVQQSEQRPHDDEGLFPSELR